MCVGGGGCVCFFNLHVTVPFILMPVHESASFLPVPPSLLSAHWGFDYRSTQEPHYSDGEPEQGATAEEQEEK